MVGISQEQNGTINIAIRRNIGTKVQKNLVKNFPIARLAEQLLVGWALGLIQIPPLPTGWDADEEIKAES